jgi:hypothetical protein
MLYLQRAGKAAEGERCAFVVSYKLWIGQGCGEGCVGDEIRVHARLLHVGSWCLKVTANTFQREFLEPTYYSERIFRHLQKSKINIGENWCAVCR